MGGDTEKMHVKLDRGWNFNDMRSILADFCMVLWIGSPRIWSGSPCSDNHARVQERQQINKRTCQKMNFGGVFVVFFVRVEGVNVTGCLGCFFLVSEYEY